ncbi:MAG: hypothetical protein MUE36_10480 [Acidimicrobiales bacterium]|jgi:hypothetical protein|nr:hypothetical protein [Acidimicrobiales bacterium]
MTPEEIDALRKYWDGIAFWNSFEPPPSGLRTWVGEGIRVEGESLVLRFREQGGSEILGVRFRNDRLPVPGIAFVGQDVATPEDWYLDRRIGLGEELDTGLLQRCDRVSHVGWTELLVDPGVWTWEPMDIHEEASRRPITSWLRRIRHRDVR